jgi:hypothetical protein
MNCPEHQAAIAPGCVKTQKNSVREKIDLSEPPLRGFLDAGNGHPTHEYFVFLRFYTASPQSRRLFSAYEVAPR